MPIRVQDELPAVNFLRDENVFVMTTSRATGQEIRPLKVLILNLMPKKIETENQFLRLLSNSPLQLDIQLLRIDARESRNTPTEHLNNFYCNFDDIRDQNFDGLIVTGAPLDDSFLAPHSRYADFPAQLIRDYTDLEILAETEGGDAYLFASKDKRIAFVTGHPEYDAHTLASEFFRDVDAGLTPEVPYNYFPKDDPNNKPHATWRSHGNLLFANWLNYYVYQITPYDLRNMNPTLD